MQQIFTNSPVPGWQIEAIVGKVKKWPAQNSNFLTSEECLAQMFRDEQGRDPTEEDFRVSFGEILRSLMAKSIDVGIALGRAPQLLQQVGESDTYKLCSFEDL